MTGEVVGGLYSNADDVLSHPMFFRDKLECVRCQGEADGVLLVRRGDATTQIACYRLSLLSHVFDTNNTLNPLQPSNQISAIERSFAKLQKDLQHQAILFLIAFYVQ